jgi:hypothetical protein
MSPVSVLVWTGTLVFVFTSAITLLALVGKVRLGGGNGSKHDLYLRRLFAILLTEIVSVGLYAFGASIRNEVALIADLQTRASQLDSLRAREADLARIAQAKVDSLSRITRLRVDTLVRDVRATSTGAPKTASVRIPIPDGWEFVDTTVTRRSATGRGSSDVVLERDANRVTAVRASVRAEAVRSRVLGVRIGAIASHAISVGVVIREIR